MIKNCNTSVLEKHQVKFLLNKFGVNSLEDVGTKILKNLKETLKSNIDDQRQNGKIKYKIWDIIICVIVANFANVYDWEDISIFVESHYNFFHSFLKMTGGVPTGQTYERVFSLIDNNQLEDILIQFYTDLIVKVALNDNIYDIDGKVSRKSKRNETSYNEEVKPLNSLNVYSNSLGICVASEMIDDKTNEMHGVEDILDRFNVKDSIITWDALNTQTFNVKKVISKEGDYVVPVKANQGNFYQDLIDYFDDKNLELIIAGKNNSAYIKQVEKSHSSIITYEYFQTEDVDWYFDKDKWTGLKSIGLVKKSINNNGKLTIETRYYISSLHIDIYNFSKAIRMHWSVENKLHWHLDFTFKDDDNTTMNKKALMNLQIVNKFVLGILNRVKSFYNNISLKKIRTHLTFDFEKNFIELLTFLALT